MVTARTLARARADDEQAFRELTGPCRRELLMHCYLPSPGAPTARPYGMICQHDTTSPMVPLIPPDQHQP